MKSKYIIAALLSALAVHFSPAQPQLSAGQSEKAKAQLVSGKRPQGEETVTSAERKQSTHPTIAQIPSSPPATEQVAAAQPLTDKQAIMQQAGIAEQDWAAVDYIASRESSWNPSAVNPNSGSCGLIQELPCGKSGCNLGDAVCQLRWASNYAVTRYGSWWAAHTFWQANRWW